MSLFSFFILFLEKIEYVKQIYIKEQEYEMYLLLIYPSNPWKHKSSQLI